MTKIEILLKVQDVFRNVFNNEKLIINMETTANDIEEWTSLTHMQLIAAEEEALGMKFKLREILKWKSVGDMVNCIADKSN